nr:uncharacterized protein LOC109742851 [Aegilops tauschii subsp. strangulata]
MPGFLNDINVVNQSPLVNKIANGELPPVQFVANGRTYNYGYYLADGIYSKWQTFVKPLKKREAANYASFSPGYALELEKKLAARDAEVAALREQLEAAKAELAVVQRAASAAREKANAELAGELRICLLPRRACRALSAVGGSGHNIDHPDPC